MKHAYNIECACERCRKEYQRRMRQALNDPRDRVKRRHAPAERVATREEQHARYIDCGPAAWDDR